MGSLSSRPKVPSVQTQYVYVPAYVPPVTTDTGASGGNSPDPDQLSSEAREASLLSRNRGRFGTVLTGFTGLLSPSESADERKSLLGE